MTRSEWNAVGYYESSPYDFIVQPIFSDTSQLDRKFAQFTFASTNDYFEFHSIDFQGCVLFDYPYPANPKSILYFGIRVGGHVDIVEMAQLRGYLSKINFNDLPDSAKIQYLDLISPFEREVALKGEGVTIEDSDFSFFATLSAQQFIETAISNVKASASLADVAREAVRCSRWVTDWTINSIPRPQLSSLLTKLSISKVELELALSNEMADATHRYGAPQSDPKIDPFRAIAGVISRLSRQELRIAELLRAVVLDDFKGQKILQSYAPQTKYERLIFPILAEATRKTVGSELRHREFVIADVISKIFVKYFPIRRGRFIVDFLRVLGDFPVIKQQMVAIYQQKMDTYGVGLYGSVIENLIREDDEAADHLRGLINF